MKIVMTVMSDVVRDARVLREARTLQSAGHDVVVYGLRPPDEPSLPGDVDIRWVGGSSAFPRGRSPRRGRRLFRMARWALLPSHIRSLERSFHTAVLREAADEVPDAVHAHDFDTLELGATVAAQRGAKIVYDTHEAWLHRDRPGRPTPAQDLRIQRAEARLGSQADVVITVSPSLARWLNHRYGWSHVEVVRNTFPPLDPTRQTAPLPGRPRGLTYAGRIGRGRDLETAMAAISRTGLRLTLVGPRDPSFAVDVDGVDVKAPVPVDAVDDVLRAQGLALVCVSDGPLNHRVALPNKLFQAVRAGVPVVASDLPELRRVVTRYQLGTLFRPGDAASFVQAAHEAVARYDEFRSNVRTAQRELSWETDAQVLIGIYRRLGGAGDVR